MKTMYAFDSDGNMTDTPVSPQLLCELQESEYPEDSRDLFQLYVHNYRGGNMTKENLYALLAVVGVSDPSIFRIAEDGKTMIGMNGLSSDEEQVHNTKVYEMLCVERKDGTSVLEDMRVAALNDLTMAKRFGNCCGGGITSNMNSKNLLKHFLTDRPNWCEAREYTKIPRRGMSVYKSTSDDWFPNYDGGYVKVRVGFSHPTKDHLVVSISGMDDHNMALLLDNKNEALAAFFELIKIYDLTHEAVAQVFDRYHKKEPVL